MENSRLKERNKFLEFQKVWTLDKVKNMTLEEYSKIGSKDTFTYILEWWLPYEFGGGDAGAKFGIYAANNAPKKDYHYDGKYAWDKKLGKDRDKAFATVRDEIVRVIEFVREGKIEEIDKLDKVLFFGFKWKIAFAYQDFDHMKIGYIFSKKIYGKIANGENLGDMSVAQIHRHYLKNNETFETMLKRYKPLWKTYGENAAMNPSNTEKTQKIPLNQILYGPPGTGKTYATIDKALEILALNDGDFLSSDKEQIEKKAKIRQILADLKTNPSDKYKRKKAKAIFDEFKNEGQIEFVTFHQSFSYEEFVEGIKPVVKNGNTTYEVKAGVFKEICASALENLENSKKSLEILQKELSTKELFEKFANDIQERLERNETIPFSTNSLNTAKNFTEVRFENNEAKSIAICAPNSTPQVLTLDIVERDYDRFKKGEIKSRKDIKPTHDSRSQQHGNADYYFAFYEHLSDFEKSKNFKLESTAQKVDLKPYILIIDEINRGNISKILGELITLIEPSKRIGAAEELRVRLPYADEEDDFGLNFGVPQNLYIIGTMNTADRSIALLDTALRRRFDFVEMMPDYENPLISENCDGVNLREMLKKMNARIEFLIDREHVLGHSFFIDVKSLDALKSAFQSKIIPLLQEYFYEDYAKIQAVLNDNGMILPELNDNGMIKEKPKPDFSPKFSEIVDDEKIVRKIVDSKSDIWDNPQTYIKIYE